MGLSFSFSIMYLVICLLSFHFTPSHLTSSTQPRCHDDDRSALLQFKESLIINKSASDDLSAYPKVSSWKADEENGDCCSWDGVTCSRVTGYVIKLDLSSSYLYGSINSSSSLFHLVHLQWLSLADNHFSYSKIPSRIMNFTKLSYLNISFSSFSGQIPSEILELSMLKTLDASGNHYLELKKPGLRSLVEKLTNIETLTLSQVSISSSVPDILANLSSMASLSLEECELQGEFPTKIFQLPNLYFLNVGYNPDLTGYIPEFGKGSSLEYLRLAGTRFSGEIPDSIGNLNLLSYVDITDCNFSGRIPPAVGNLTKINYLYLSGNNFSGQHSSSLSWLAKHHELTYLALAEINLFGEIPSWLMNLTRLTDLHLSHNELTGPIPSWLMKLNQVVVLTLSSNRLIGHIPCQIGNLTQLQFLALGSNQLRGLIPSALHDLENLYFLDLGSNKLSGTMDLTLLVYKLKNLEILVLSSNALSLSTKTNVQTDFQKFYLLHLRSCNLVEFPNFLQNQDRLEILDLSSNKLSGPIPEWFLKLSIDYFLYLNLSYNLLTGFDQLPVILPWTRLRSIDLRSNHLQGPLPVPPLSTRIYLVSYNNLTGEIPPLICNLSQLKALDLSHNNLNGKLPQCVGNFSHLLSSLNLQNNKFHGSIPPTLVNGANLRMIDLSHNLLQGRIPRALANCTELEFLDLGNNQINDAFPSWLKSLPKLKVLILQSNKLSGVIREPETDQAFPELRIIDLSHNRFTGNLPSKYFESWHAMKVMNASGLTYLHDEMWPFDFLTPYNVYFDFFVEIYDYSLKMSIKGIELEYRKISNILTAIFFSGNRFVGEIPASIANLRGLHYLNLSNNGLSSHIPSSLSNLTELEALDLSNNRLSGQIPQQLAELTFLSLFNVSNNNLMGPIPHGNQFDTFDNNSFNGSPALCGKPLSKECENFEASETQDGNSQSLFGFDWKIIMIGYSSGLIVGVVLSNICAARRYESYVKNLKRRIKRFGRKSANA